MKDKTAVMCHNIAKYNRENPMPNEMNHAEVANTLEVLYSYRKDEDIPEIQASLQAAADERRIEKGKLVPVVHAEWQSAAGGWPYCSNCDTNALEGGDEEPVESKHCPNCGALMDGKDDSHEID